MSTLFLKDPKVQRMVDRHGNDAVAVSLALMAEAMCQERGGEVVLTYRQLANDANTGRDEAHDIVETAVQVGLLNLESGDDFEFQVKFPAWSRHQAAFRKAKSRAAQKPLEQANVTPSHEQVTPGHKKSLTGQDKTRQKKKPLSPDKPPTDSRVVFDAWVQATGKNPNQVKFTSDRRSLIDRQLKNYPVGDLVDAVKGWRHSPHHRGENDRGTVYNDIELLLKNARNIEKFRDLERRTSRPRPVMPQPEFVRP